MTGRTAGAVVGIIVGGMEGCSIPGTSKVCSEVRERDVLGVVSFTAAAGGGGVACGMFDELSCSEVGTLWTGAWSDVLGPGTSSGWQRGS